MSEKKNGSILTAEKEIDYWEKLENHYRDLYDSQVEKNNAAAAEATQRTLQQIGEQIDALNAQFKENNRALYRGFRDAERKLPQQLAAEGITGGLSESSHVKLNADYREDLGRRTQERDGSVAELERRGLETESENLARAQEKNDAALENYRAQQLSLEKQKHSALERQAAALGKTGDFSLYEQLGYSKEQITALRNAWEEKNPKLAVAQAIQNGGYSAERVAGMSVKLAKLYLGALGYRLKNTDAWDAETERAYFSVFGKKSGRV